MTVLTDHESLRTVLGHYPTGVTVVTGIAPDGEALAMVVGSFTSVSLDPPLVSFLPMRSSRTFAQLARCRSLCINVLTAEQEQLCRTIGSRGQDKLAGVNWRSAPSGAPVLARSLAWLEVRLRETVEAGDHWIALCEVTDLEVQNPVAPLLFFQGGYGSFAVPSLIARLDADNSVGVTEAARVRDELESLAAALPAECSLHKVLNSEELETVAVATAPGVSPTRSLGRRLPLVPPIGDVWAASQPQAEQESWLRKAIGATEDQLATWRDRLRFCREHGFLLTFSAGPGDFDELGRSTEAYAETHLTPAGERELRRGISAAARPEKYRLREVDSRQHYDIASLIVPVNDSRGQPSLVLRITALPANQSGTRVLAWADQAQAAARSIENRLNTEP